MPQDRGAVQSHPAGAGAPLRETSVETVQRCQPSPTAIAVTDPPRSIKPGFPRVRTTFNGAAGMREPSRVGASTLTTRIMSRPDTLRKPSYCDVIKIEDLTTQKDPQIMFYE